MPLDRSPRCGGNLMLKALGSGDVSFFNPCDHGEQASLASAALHKESTLCAGIYCFMSPLSNHSNASSASNAISFIRQTVKPRFPFHILAGLGNTLLYRLTPTASIGLIFPSNVALKYPCVPRLSLIKPCLPLFVHSGNAENQATSSLLKNI